MTNEEVFNKNKNIAYKIASNYKNCGVEQEDLKQMCLIGLWKAVITYKKGKNCALSTYSYRVIQNEINDYLRRNRKNFLNRSFSEKTGENIVLEDTLESKIDYIEKLEKDLDNKTYLNQIKNSKLKEKEKQVLELLAKGYRQRKIANTIGISQPQVSRIIKNLRKKIKI